MNDLTLERIGKAIRHIRESKSLTLEGAAFSVGIQPSNLSRLERGKQGFTNSSIQKIAEALNCQLSEIFKMAEEGTDADGSWKISVAGAEPGPDIKGYCPLISWIQAGAWCGVIDNFQPGDAESWHPCPVSHGPRTYVLKVRGISMEPKFQEGQLIFVDPDKDPVNRSYVIAKIDDENEATFKQYIIEGNKRYLKALNPAWPDRMFEISENIRICGVVIFFGEALI